MGTCFFKWQIAGVVKRLITEGKKEIAIYSPSFVADCLETTDELGHELVNEAKEWGGNVYLENSWEDDYSSSSQEAYQVEFSTEDNLYILAVKDSWSNSYGGDFYSNEQWNIYKIDPSGVLSWDNVEWNAKPPTLSLILKVLETYVH